MPVFLVILQHKNAHIPRFFYNVYESPRLTPRLSINVDIPAMMTTPNIVTYIDQSESRILHSNIITYIC